MKIWHDFRGQNKYDGVQAKKPVNWTARTKNRLVSRVGQEHWGLTGIFHVCQTFYLSSPWLCFCPAEAQGSFCPAALVPRRDPCISLGGVRYWWVTAMWLTLWRSVPSCVWSWVSSLSREDSVIIRSWLPTSFPPVFNDFIAYLSPLAARNINKLATAPARLPSPLIWEGD